MEEKYMVNDILNDYKNSIKAYTEAIVECENTQLRTTMQTLRNSLESIEYELFKISESKGYYTPAEQVEQNDINKIKNEFDIES